LVADSERRETKREVLRRTCSDIRKSIIFYTHD
jgi:hypothetical protein